MPETWPTSHYSYSHMATVLVCLRGGCIDGYPDFSLVCLDKYGLCVKYTLVSTMWCHNISCRALQGGSEDSWRAKNIKGKLVKKGEKGD